MSRVTVDIIIPTKDESDSIGMCLLALAEQDYPRELINIYVVDSSTNQLTLEACDGFNCHSLSIGLQSPAAQRNFGIRAGAGNLVGFLDAHSKPDSDWISEMVRAFVSARTGAVQGSINYLCRSPITRLLMSKTIFQSASTFSSHTVDGLHSPLPWVVTGNSFFRREVLEQCGLFDSNLCASEDLDLAWRAVLLGYELVSQPSAGLLHFNMDSIVVFLRKQFRFGRSTTQLATKYGIKRSAGARSIRVAVFDPLACLVSAAYSGGSLFEAICASPGGMHSMPLRSARVPERFRQAFRWNGSQQMRISRHTVVWRVSASAETVLLNLRTLERFTVDGSASLIVHLILQSAEREQVIHALTEKFEETNSRILIDDMDEFVGTLKRLSLIEVG